MAARQALHISYIGEDVNDGSRRNPAAPLAELLDSSRRAVRRDKRRRSDLADPPSAAAVRSPLLHTDEAAIARLFSFDRAYEIDDRARAEKHPFVDHAARTGAGGNRRHHAEIAAVILARSIARNACATDLGIGLDALGDDALLDNEPLDARHSTPRTLRDATARPRLAERRSGIAVGTAGMARAHRRAAGRRPRRARVRAPAHARAADARCDAAIARRRCERISPPVDIDLGDCATASASSIAFTNAPTAPCIFSTRNRDGTANFRDLLPFYIDYAALRLSGIDIVPDFLECADKKARAQRRMSSQPIVAQNEDALRQGLQRPHPLPRDAAHSPLFFFPKTSWCWTTAADDKRDAEARKAWEGNRSAQQRRTRLRTQLRRTRRARFGFPAPRIRRTTTISRRPIAGSRRSSIRTAHTSLRSGTRGDA